LIRSNTEAHEQDTIISQSSLTYAERTDGLPARPDSTHAESILSNESETSPFNHSITHIIELLRIGIPPLTRTEEKSLANALITQLPGDVPFTVAEQWARRRVCDIVLDNFSQRILSHDIAPEWFYDFLLRNPRVPIHFQLWFSFVKSQLPQSDHVIKIKAWELGLITRSILFSSYSNKLPSSSSP
jgi:hypothetical protein